MIDQRGSGGLTVTSRDTDHLGIGISASELNLTDDVDALGDDLLDHRGFIGDTRTLDHLISIQNLLFCMVSFFPLNLVVIQQFLVFVLDRSHV